MRSRRPPGILAAIALVALGCQDRPTRPNESSTITLLTHLGANVLSPFSGFTAQFLVFSPLVERTEGEAMKGVLAKSWEHDADTNTWTVHLRSDVRWHDGVPFTARDVEFTLGLYTHPEILWIAPDSYDIEVLDDSTYTIRPQTSMMFGTPDDFWMVFYPRHILQDEDPADFTEWPFWQDPIGTGPYRHVRTDPLTMIELEANPDYFRGEPRIQRVRLKLGGEIVPELLSGAVDGAPYVPWQDMGKLLEDPSLKLYSGINHQEVKAILWNHRHPALSDVRVRRALTMAIDRRTLMGLLHLPERAPVLDAPPTLAQLQNDSFPEYWSYDVERAGATLDEAGWLDTNGDGVRERSGEDFAITLLVAGAEEETAAVFVQDQLARVGVQTEIVRRDGLAVAERWQSGDFDAAVFLITSHLHGGEQDISYLYGPESPIGYHNQAVIELLERAVGASSPREVVPMYTELHPLVAADVPITPLYPVVWNWVVHERVRGLGDDRLYDPVWNMERLWIEEDGSGGPRAP